MLKKYLDFRKLNEGLENLEEWFGISEEDLKIILQDMVDESGGNLIIDCKSRVFIEISFTVLLEQGDLSVSDKRNQINDAYKKIDKVKDASIEVADRLEEYGLNIKYHGSEGIRKPNVQTNIIDRILTKFTICKKGSPYDLRKIVPLDIQDTIRFV